MTNESATHIIKGDFAFGKIKKKNIILTITIIVLLLITMISFILLLITLYGGSKQCEAGKFQSQESADQTTNVPSNQQFKVIPRREWLAQPTLEKLQELRHPIPYVIILHTASEQCKDQADCIFALRHIQAFHIESNGWWDIGYNFLIGGDGFAYEGRGWKSEGAHTYDYNSRSIGIAFIGTYNTVLPTQAQMTAAKQLIEQGVENGSIAKDYKLLAARQVSSTKSPGLTLYEEIKKWPHWSQSP